jgi:outer membrane lipoprotein carrier protein
LKCIKASVGLACLTAASLAFADSTLSAIEAKYKAAETLTAHFEQTNQNAATGTTTKSKGLIFVKVPRKIRWDTQEPQANLLVGNGKKFWLYTPPFDSSDPSEHGQVMEKKAEDVQSEFASVLLTGAFSGAVSKTIALDSEHFKLIPKKGTAGTVKEADITIDSKLLLITDVILKHEGGNVSTIHLSSIELGKPLKAELFEFKIPPGTDLIR